MVFLRQSFLILFALVLSGGNIFAASAREDRALAAAKAVFQAKLWNRAEAEFGQFREDFPASTNLPQAVLLQAQAEFQQGKFGDAAKLLRENEAAANDIEDQYIYWIGESEFGSSNFLDAADTFASLAQNFPDSTLATRSIVEAASSAAQLNEWPTVESLLDDTNGIFQRSLQMNSANETIARGQLLLARAKFKQNDFDGAADVLDSINTKILEPQLNWQRADLLCQVKSAAGDLPSALAATTNLLQIAGSRRDLIAEAVGLRGALFQKFNLPGEAIAEYQKNLKDSAPLDRQRQAILKIAEISEAQNQLTNAEQSLADFLAQFSNAPAADMALLTLGELHLKIYAADRSATNELPEAAAQFDQFIGTFTNSPLLGKAFLDRGWCDWFAGDVTNSVSDFQLAAQNLPPSEDRAVAKFKLGDAEFKLAELEMKNVSTPEDVGDLAAAKVNFTAARSNYNAVVKDFSGWTNVMHLLGDRALYQSLRASLELHDPTNASVAIAKLLSKPFRSAPLTPNAALLYSEGLGDWGKPADARDSFYGFEQLWPNSDLQPQVEFAIAHTYELEKNWPMAIEQYQNWLAEFPGNELSARVHYALAWADYENGNETNAVALFQNFVTRFSTNELAPQAQFWLGDYFYRNKEFVGAETNYERVYQDWPNSDLAYPAQLMAGRAAAGRGGNSDAINYFKAMVTDTNCPPEFAVQALFGYGSVLMNSDSGTTNPVANFYTATNIFARIIQMYPTNDYGALAWCYIGDCDLQISDFDSATNAYAQVFNSTNINVSTRSRAQVGFGIALEKKADSAGDADKKMFLQQALDNYLDVFETGFGKNLMDGEKADPFWVKTAGLKALKLIQTLGVAPPNGFIDEMEQMLPQLKDSLEKERAELSQTKS
jgi:TolA-binding protein